MCHSLQTLQTVSELPTTIRSVVSDFLESAHSEVASAVADIAQENNNSLLYPLVAVVTVLGSVVVIGIGVLLYRSYSRYFSLVV